MTRMLESFGDAGVPPIQFRMSLRWGYYVVVSVWDTRKEMVCAAAVPRSAGEQIHAVTNVLDTGRRVADLHLCQPALGNNTLVHELVHVMREYERRIRCRFRSSDALEEHIATETERSFMALRSHIDEERRLAS